MCTLPCCSANESDEEQWLLALEKGEVDRRGYLPSKDKKGNLTARQVQTSAGVIKSINQLINQASFQV